MMSNPLQSALGSVLSEENNQIEYLEQNQSQSLSIQNDNTEKEIPLLPPPREGHEGEQKELKLGESVQMDELGPMIITPEGHVRRIANWANLTKAEQAVAWRRISARNKQRIDALTSGENESEANPQDNKDTEAEKGE